MESVSMVVAGSVWTMGVRVKGTRVDGGLGG